MSLNPPSADPLSPSDVRSKLSPGSPVGGYQQGHCQHRDRHIIYTISVCYTRGSTARGGDVPEVRTTAGPAFFPSSADHGRHLCHARCLLCPLCIAISLCVLATSCRPPLYF